MDRITILQLLESVLCNPEGKCCITGSEEDRAIVNTVLDELRKFNKEIN